MPEAWRGLECPLGVGGRGGSSEEAKTWGWLPPSLDSGREEALHRPEASDWEERMARGTTQQGLQNQVPGPHNIKKKKKFQ